MVPPSGVHDSLRSRLTTVAHCATVPACGRRSWPADGSCTWIPTRWHSSDMDVSAAATAWRRDGFVVLPGYLSGPELESAQADLSSVYPTAEQYHADPSSEDNRIYAGDECSGIIPFPFPTVPLCNLAVHERLIAFVETAFETDDIRIYASELWAKYSGAVRYEQEHHRDYLNHTPLAPSSNTRWRGLEMFIVPTYPDHQDGVTSCARRTPHAARRTPHSGDSTAETTPNLTT
jgi:hypothetical protein